MKTLTFILFAALFTVQLSAQNISSTKVGNSKQYRFYADLVSKAATLNGDWGLFGGVRAGYNFDENFSLGLVAHGLIPVKLEPTYINRDDRDELHLGYVGAEATYSYSLTDKFSLAGVVMIGAGRVDYENLDGNDYFFITEPGVAFNYNITDWFGLGYSIDYRLASGVKYSDFSNASFSGWSMDLGFKFGF